MEWQLSPGDVIRRVDLHDTYGGQRQGGISTPSDNLMIFTDPDTGEQHGYHDRWVGTGADLELHYAGEGQAQHGDQALHRGNKAIAEHRETDRPIRVFYGSKGQVTYAGEFQLAMDGQPSHYTEQVESPDGSSRQVLKFRLKPVGILMQNDAEPARPLVVPEILAQPYEAAAPSPTTGGTPFAVDPNEVDRGLVAHAATQNTLALTVQSAGYTALSPGPNDPDFDVAWRTSDGVVVVAEVKSLTTTNEAGQIRLGLGQVLDYRQQLISLGFSCEAVLAVEKEPTAERWTAVCGQAGVSLVWPATFATLFPAEN